jgi:hypothetical protein
LKNILKKQIPYIIVFIVLFYGIPMLYKLTAPADASADFMATMLYLANPAVCLGVSAWYGFKHRFKWYYLLLSPVLFFPSVFIFYNPTAIVFTALYLVFCLLGLGFGIILNIITNKASKSSKSN